MKKVKVKNIVNGIEFREAHKLIAEMDITKYPSYKELQEDLLALIGSVLV